MLLLPLLAGALAYHAWKRKLSHTEWLHTLCQTTVFPALLICMIVAANNWVKFGDITATGYHQWNDEGRVDFLNALFGLTFTAQWSLFIAFPPLLLALLAWKRFWREHTEEATFILIVFFVFLCLIGNRRDWSGAWAYGPRYFLFVVPVLSLPLLYILEWAGRNVRHPSGYLTLSGLAVAAIFLLIMQWQVNRLTWFFKYEVAADLIVLKDPEINNYFDRTNFAKINWDYWRARHDLTKIPYYDRIRSGLNNDQMERFLSDVRQRLSRPNLFWRPKEDI